MPPLGPLAPIIGAFAMIGLAVATFLGSQRGEAPEPASGPREDMRLALSAFAQWLHRQPRPIRNAAAGPAQALLADGADLVAAFPEDGLNDPAVLAAHGAISRDLPATTALADQLPASALGSAAALAPFIASLNTIAAATGAALSALGREAITRLEIQQHYLDAKFPPPPREFDQEQ